MEGTCSIKEVAKKLGVSISVIRKYEEDYSLSILRNEIGHRVYTDKDIEVLKRILELKNEGANIHLIKKILHKEELIDLPAEVLDNIPATYTNNIDQFKRDIVKELNDLMIAREKQMQEQFEDKLEQFKLEIIEKQREQIQVENEKLLKHITMTREKEEKSRGFFSRLFKK